MNNKLNKITNKDIDGCIENMKAFNNLCLYNESFKSFRDIFQKIGSILVGWDEEYCVRNNLLFIDKTELIEVRNLLDKARGFITDFALVDKGFFDFDNLTIWFDAFIYYCSVPLNEFFDETKVVKII